MKFCTNCGAPLIQAIPPGDDRLRLVCTLCAKVHYQSPRVLVTCLATWQGKALWMRRATPPQEGFWSVPGGYKEAGESLRQAAARELHEETCVELDAKDMVLYGVGSLLHIDQIYVSFRAELKTPEFSITAEASELALFNQDDLPWGELAYPELVPSISNFYRELKTGQFGIYMGEYAPENTYLEDMS
ncbi:MAG: NUDIX hydrolase [Pseudomonadales bacterium]